MTRRLLIRDLLPLTLFTALPALAQEMTPSPGIAIDRGNLLHQLAPDDLSDTVEAAALPPVTADQKRQLENEVILNRAGLIPSAPGSLADKTLPLYPEPSTGENALDPDFMRGPDFSFPDSIPVLRPPIILPFSTPVLSTSADEPLDTLPAAPTTDEPAATKPAVVQLDRLLATGDTAALTTNGIQIEGYLGGTTYLISGDQDKITQSPLGGMITAGRMMTASDKILEAATLQRQGRRASDTPGAEDRYFLEALKGTNTETLAGDVLRLGAATAVAAPGGVVVMAAEEVVDALAAHDAVIAVDVGPTDFHPLNNQLRELLQVDQIQKLVLSDNNPPHFGGLTGRNVRIAVYDTPVYESHADFCSLEHPQGPSRFFGLGTPHPHCPVSAAGLEQTAPDPHGTHVAGIIAGNGFNSLKVLSQIGSLPEFGFRGIAPRALLVARDFQKPDDLDLGEFAASLAIDGADVSNHSYIESAGKYDSRSSAIDSAIAGQMTVTIAETARPQPVPARPQVWSAGNNAVKAPTNYENRLGYGSVFTQAKNSISVGSIDTQDPNRVSVFSSLGPTFDGRIKPDLVAPGCHDTFSPNWKRIRAPNGRNQGYSEHCGTSMAAPVVTGAIALMREAAGLELRPASYKAILVATAQDMVQETAPANAPPNHDTSRPTTFGVGPDFATGFGLVRIGAAVDMVATSGQWRESVLSDQDPGQCFTFEQAPDGQPLRVALAWDDPPAPLSDFSIARLVNDLDLRLIAPDGMSHFPWVLLPPPQPDTLEAALADEGGSLVDWPNPSAKRGTVDLNDNLNNVELAEVDQPAPGQWRVEITTNGLGVGPTQQFSVAANVNLNPDCTM